MNKKTRYTAVNTHLFLCITALALSAGMLWASVTEKEVTLTVISVIMSLPALFVLFTSPIKYVFTEQDVTIVYWFGLRETISWSSVRNIYISGSWLSSESLPHYVLCYPQCGKRAFFMNGEISKTFRTKKLVKKFWHKKIS